MMVKGDLSENSSAWIPCEVRYASQLSSSPPRTLAQLTTSESVKSLM